MCFGHDAVRHVNRHEGGDDVLEGEDDGLRVLDGDGGDVLAQARRADRAAVRVHVEFVGELHIVGGEGLAVVPLDALLQREGEGLAVRRDLPFGGEVRRRLQGIRIGKDERVEEQRHEAVRDDIALRHRVEGGDIAARADDDRAALLDARRINLRTCTLAARGGRGGSGARRRLSRGGGRGSRRDVVAAAAARARCRRWCGRCRRRAGRCGADAAAAAVVALGRARRCSSPYCRRTPRGSPPPPSLPPP